MFSDQDADGSPFEELELIEAINNPPVGVLDFSRDLVWPAHSSFLSDIADPDLIERLRERDPYNCL